jgi:hypothetical protein
MVYRYQNRSLRQESKPIAKCDRHAHWDKPQAFKTGKRVLTFYLSPDCLQDLQIKALSRLLNAWISSQCASWSPARQLLENLKVTRVARVTRMAYSPRQLLENLRTSYVMTATKREKHYLPSSGLVLRVSSAFC